MIHPGHRILHHGEWWVVEREYDPGYLGDGSRKGHDAAGRAVVDVARAMAANPDHQRPGEDLEVWGWTVSYEGYRYGVTNVAAREREEKRRADAAALNKAAALPFAFPGEGEQ